MKNKIKKLILIGLVLVIMLFAVTNIGLFSRIDDACGCADSYMGASFVSSTCIFVGGELVFRRCEYEY